MASLGTNKSVCQSEIAQRASIDVHGGSVMSIALRRGGGGGVAVATGATLTLLASPTELEVQREISASDAAGGAAVSAVAFGGSGTELVTGGADGFVRWWAVSSGEQVCATQFPQTDGGQLPITEVACSRAGFVAAASGRCAAAVALPAPLLLPCLQHMSSRSCRACLRNTTRHHGVLLWPHAAVTATHHCGMRRYLCVFGQGGEHLHTMDAEGDGASVTQIAWLGDTTVAACCGRELTLWSVGQELYQELGACAPSPADAIVTSAASPDGHLIAAACSSGVIQVWDTKALQRSMDPMMKMSGGTAGRPVTRLAWDSTSRLLAAAAGGELLVW